MQTSASKLVFDYANRHKDAQTVVVHTLSGNLDVHNIGLTAHTQECKPVFLNAGL